MGAWPIWFICTPVGCMVWMLAVPVVDGTRGGGNAELSGTLATCGCIPVIMGCCMNCVCCCCIIGDGALEDEAGWINCCCCCCCWGGGGGETTGWALNWFIGERGGCGGWFGLLNCIAICWTCDGGWLAPGFVHCDRSCGSTFCWLTGGVGRCRGSGETACGRCAWAGGGVEGKWFWTGCITGAVFVTGWAWAGGADTGTGGGGGGGGGAAHAALVCAMASLSAGGFTGEEVGRGAHASSANPFSITGALPVFEGWETVADRDGSAGGCAGGAGEGLRGSVLNWLLILSIMSELTPFGADVVGVGRPVPVDLFWWIWQTCGNTLCFTSPL